MKNEFSLPLAFGQGVPGNLIIEIVRAYALSGNRLSPVVIENDEVGPGLCRLGIHNPDPNGSFIVHVGRLMNEDVCPTAMYQNIVIEHHEWPIGYTILYVNEVDTWTAIEEAQYNLIMDFARALDVTVQQIYDATAVLLHGQLE